MQTLYLRFAWLPTRKDLCWLASTLSELKLGRKVTQVLRQWPNKTRLERKFEGRMRSFAPMFGPGFRKPESTRVRARLWMTLEDLITKFFNINATSPAADTWKYGQVLPSLQKRFDNGFWQNKTSLLTLGSS